eukprot:5981614-Pyramimonas_sp.AAC.1
MSRQSRHLFKTRTLTLATPENKWSIERVDASFLLLHPGVLASGQMRDLKSNANKLLSWNKRLCGREISRCRSRRGRKKRTGAKDSSLRVPQIVEYNQLLAHNRQCRVRKDTVRKNKYQADNVTIQELGWGWGSKRYIPVPPFAFPHHCALPNCRLMSDRLEKAEHDREQLKKQLEHLTYEHAAQPFKIIFFPCASIFCDCHALAYHTSPHSAIRSCAETKERRSFVDQDQPREDRGSARHALRTR